MRLLLLWLAWLALLIAVMVAAFARAAAPVQRVPWLAIGLFLWASSELVAAEGFDFD